MPGKGPLSEAMKKDADKTAGAGGGDGDEEENGVKKSRASRVIQAYGDATGRRVAAAK